MNLNNEIRNLSVTLEKNQNKIQILEKENEIKKAKLYQAKIELLDDLDFELEMMLNYNNDLFNREIRNEIIEALLNYSVIINNKNYTRAFLIENYNKQAKKILSEQKNELKAKEKQQNDFIKQQEIDLKMKQQNFINTLNLIKTLCVIALSPFILLMFFIIRNLQK